MGNDSAKSGIISFLFIFLWLHKDLTAGLGGETDERIVDPESPHAAGNLA